MLPYPQTLLTGAGRRRDNATPGLALNSGFECSDINAHRPPHCRIQAILVQHIKKRLPDLRTEVAALEREKRSELLRLGTSVANGSTDFLRETMIRQLTQYSRNFSDGLQARFCTLRVWLCCFRVGAATE